MTDDDQLEKHKQFRRSLIPHTVVPKKWARGMGYLSVWHGYMEQKLDQLLWALFNHDRDILESMLGALRYMKERLDFAESLGNDKFTDEQLKDFHAVIVTLNAANEKRNKIIHGPFGGGSFSYEIDGTTLRSAVLSKEKINRKGKKTSAVSTYKDITVAAIECLRAGEATERFLWKYKIYTPASWQT